MDVNFFDFNLLLLNEAQRKRPWPSFLLLKWGQIQTDENGDHYIDFKEAGGATEELAKIRLKTPVERMDGKFQVEKIDQQRGRVYLGKMVLGQQIKAHFGIWQLKFGNVKQDNIEGYYYDWADDPGSINNLEDVQVGDQIGDHALNMTPYWKVTYVDHDKSRIYVDPIKPNPLASYGAQQQGGDEEDPVISIGAGGAPIRQSDLKVLTGEHEKERVDYVMDNWKKGHIYNPSDVAYLLLGTVPTNFGPNGPQGGWYNLSDTMSNRGGHKSMSPQEIMVADANTLKNTFHFKVPKKALTGELEPGLFNSFVNGGLQDWEKDGTEVEGEDFNDLHATINMILTAKEPVLKLRNTEVLFDRFYTRYREFRKTRYNDPGYEEAEAKWKAGGYTNKELEPTVKMIAEKLARIFHPTAKGTFDPYYLTKEKFIYLAGQKGWNDVLKLYEDAPDNDNRRKVFDCYDGNYGKTAQQPEKMLEMLYKEPTAENLHHFLSRCYKIKPQETLKFIEEKDWLDLLNQKYYGEELKRVLDNIKQREEFFKKHGEKFGKKFGDFED